MMRSPRLRSPRLRSHRLRTVLAAAGAVLLGLAVAAPAAASGAPAHTPTAYTSHGYRATGALFPHGLANRHSCTGSVVMSASHDLAITAAHCLTGTATGWSFVPKYAVGAAPYGVWRVVHVYLPAAWLKNQDSRHDYAVLQLAKRRIGGQLRGVQDVVGGYRVATARAGEAIHAPGYNAGRNDRPISCATHDRLTGSYPTFDCHGYLGGSSGTPWLVDVPGAAQRDIHGLIGGLHHGGCYEYTSYSSPFDADTSALIARAAARRHPDTAPRPGDDGC